MKNIELYNEDNLEVMKKLPDESIDVICIDPPYLYLKGQKLERPFDEQKFFEECKRLLTKDGFIIMFGRGSSFYRWNNILDNLKFSFKEEVVWDKSQCSSPLMNLSRVHETASIFTKGKGIINKVKVPYLEMKGHDLSAVITDVKRLKTTFKNTKSLDAVLSFLDNNYSEKDLKKVHKHVVCQSDEVKNIDRSVSVMQCIKDGMNEKSIIKSLRDHYTSIHPTQKPVQLLTRLLKLVLPDKNEIVIADWFGGSMSTMEAVCDLQKEFFEKQFFGISTEIDEEYFSLGKERIDNLNNSQLDIFSL